MQEMNADAVDLGLELIVRVDALGDALHVVLVRPVGTHFFHVSERYSLAPVVGGFRFGKPGVFESPLEISDGLIGNLDGKWGNVCHGWSFL